eukprot:1627906-Rhodomonas_salina.1
MDESGAIGEDGGGVKMTERGGHGSEITTEGPSEVGEGPREVPREVGGGTRTALSGRMEGIARKIEAFRKRAAMASSFLGTNAGASNTESGPVRKKRQRKTIQQGASTSVANQAQEQRKAVDQDRG